MNTVRLLLGYALNWDVIDDIPIKKPIDEYEVYLACWPSADLRRNILSQDV